MCYSSERFRPVFSIIYFIYDSINCPTGKVAHFGFCVASSLIKGVKGFAVAVVLSKIVGTLETKMLWGVQENQSFLYTVLSTYQ